MAEVIKQDDFSHLSDAIKTVSVSILEAVRDHKLKAGDTWLQAIQMIEQGVELARDAGALVTDVKDHMGKWWDDLKKLLQALQPFFDSIRDFLVSCYEHLVKVFDWCKEMWHKIFG